MNLIEFLLKASWMSVLAAAITGSISGMGSAAAIALINRSISQITPAHPQAPSELLWGFAGLVVVSLVTTLVSQFLLAQLAQDAIYKLRLRISGWILASPLRHLEELGTSRLLATLTEDIQAISSGVFSIPTLCVNAAIVIASLVYLGWLSIGVLVGTLVFMALSIAIVQLLINQAVRSFTAAREENDALMSHFQAITNGIKAAKISCKKTCKLRLRPCASIGLAPNGRSRYRVGLASYHFSCCWDYWSMDYRRSRQFRPNSYRAMF
jgi:putative pyoverdin transport system ATP-binding/permease protein